MKTKTLFLAFAALRAFTADFNVTVNCNNVLFTHDSIYHGVNYVGFWDNAQGSAGSREALRRAGVKIIRFPGGEPGNFYDWSQTTTWTSTTMTTLSAYAKGVGAKLMLQTNPTTNKVNDGGSVNDPSAQHAAAWVTYCKNNNVPAPLWEVGNEPESGNNWQQADWDSTKLRWYYDKFNQQARAMKAADPSLTVLGPVAANAWYWWGVHDLAMFLKFCDTTVDQISLHWYPYGSANPGWDNVKSLAQSWQSNMDYIRSVTQKKLYITEWSAHGYNAGSLQNVMALALSSADIVGAFAKSGVSGHCWFGTIHNVTGDQWGFLYGPGQAKPLDTPAPSYYILPLWARMGNQVLGLTSTANASTTLSAYAHKKSNGSVQVMLINKVDAKSVALSFTGFNPSGKQVGVYELKPKNGGVWDADVVYNGADNPNASQVDLPAPSSVSADSATYVRTLAPYSITVLDFASPTAGERVAPFQAASLPKAGKIVVVNGRVITRHPLLSSGRPLSLYTIEGRRLASIPMAPGGRLKPGSTLDNGIYLLRDETR